MKKDHLSVYLDYDVTITVVNDISLSHTQSMHLRPIKDPISKTPHYNGHLLIYSHQQRSRYIKHTKGWLAGSKSSHHGGLEQNPQVSSGQL
jgi:hypothetical protein